MGGAQWGGSEALWVSLAQYALHKGDKVFISVYKWPEVHPKIKELEESGASIFYRKRHDPEPNLSHRIRRFINKRRPSLDEDYASIIQFKPNHIFISQGDNFDLPLHHASFYRLIKENKIPYSIVCHNHEPYHFLPEINFQLKAKEIFTNAKAIFFVSHTQQKITERIILTQLTNGYFTWNPLNFNKIPINILQISPLEKINMAIVASLITGKGHDVLFQILSSTEWRNRNWNLNCYGDGPGKDYLIKLSEFLNLSEKIIFHGHVDQIRDIWQRNQILLIPSSREGLPISLIEAMACGRPVVATDVGGISEIVKDGETGYLADAPSVKSFDKALEHAWEDRESWGKIGERAFEIVQAKVDLNPESKIYNMIKQENLNAR